MQKGRLFKSDVDTEVFVHLIAESKKKSLLDRLMECLLHVKGAYSLVLLHGDRSKDFGLCVLRLLLCPFPCITLSTLLFLIA